MESDRNNQGLKTTLEMGPIIAFFVCYIWLKDKVFTIAGTEYSGFVVVTAGFIPLLLLSTALLWWLTGHLSKMQIMTAVLVTVFGGMSVWFNDPRFFKMKPTIIYLIFSGILWFGLWRGKSYLRSVMNGVLPIDDAGWIKLTRRLATFFLALAVANECVWRTQSESTWVYFKTFGLTLTLFIFMMSQSGLFKTHALEDENTKR